MAAGSSDAILAVTNLTAMYQNIVGVRDVSLAVERSSIVVLLGANGAGKTTTLRAISNLLSFDRGEVSTGLIEWQGRSTQSIEPALLARSGMVQILEGRHVFQHLTVEENILTGAYSRKLKRAQVTAEVDRIYAWFPKLKDRRKTKCGLTSGGEQQMVAIGRALMTRPSLMLLDEPSMGLAPMIVEEIFEIIHKLNASEGVSFLIAEQNARVALRYANWVYVLESGGVALSKPTSEIGSDSDFSRFYLGD